MVGLGAVVVNRAHHHPVLVHGPRPGPGVADAGQQLLNVAGRDLGSRAFRVKAAPASSANQADVDSELKIAPAAVGRQDG